MPKRQNTQKLASPELQGDDSYIIMVSPKVGEMDDFRAVIAPLNTEIDNLRKSGQDGSSEFAELTQELEDLSRDLIPRFVKSWNWVDDNDEPLPQPDQINIKELTIHELQWLTRQFTLSVQEKKD